TVLFSRTLPLKKPRLWPVRFVILPQQFQYFSRKRRNPVFATFRLPDEHHVPLRIYILWFQAKQLTPPQSATVDKAQHRFMLDVIVSLQDIFHLFFTQNVR